MQGDPEVIEFLNEQLTAELTAINQYLAGLGLDRGLEYCPAIRPTFTTGTDAA
ncbi:hypothetical protein SFUMM280S_04353 [Streptomyces fumanus]